MNGRKIGFILLAIFLIIYGVLAVTNVRFEFQNALLGFSALLAGVFLLLDR